MTTLDPVFQTYLGDLVRNTSSTYDTLNELVGRWKRDYLDSASPGVTDDPTLDDFAKPVIAVAEILRHQGHLSLAQRVYLKAIEFADQRCVDKGINLHRGALYANLAITYLDMGQYGPGLPWLHAGAQQDFDHRSGLVSLYDTYAFSDSGIFGQWLENIVLPKLPPAVLGFVDTHLGLKLTPSQLKGFFRWAAGAGDLGVVSGIVDFATVGNAQDMHSHSVRLTCLRSLATFFEVALKKLGTQHKDASVAAEFADPPMLAGIICHTHFVPPDPRKRRSHPRAVTKTTTGIFHNSKTCLPSLIDAVDAGIDTCADKARTLVDVMTYLKATTLSTSTSDNEVAKRFLCAYKVRNLTSHTFAPSDPGTSPCYGDARTWTLQAILWLYSWALQSGDVTL